MKNIIKSYALLPDDVMRIYDRWNTLDKIFKVDYGDIKRREKQGELILDEDKHDRISVEIFFSSLGDDRPSWCGKKMMESLNFTDMDSVCFSEYLKFMGMLYISDFLE